MPEDTPQIVTRLVLRCGSGDARAADELLPLVYDELRRLARWHMSQERDRGAGHTLQPTALVHEAFGRLAANSELQWNDRRHFFAAAAVAMRRILVERARRVAGPKRGGGRIREQLNPDGVSTPAIDDVDAGETDWIVLDAAMTELQATDPALAEIVHLRYFACLSIDQTAQALGISDRTVDRQWKIARAWLLDAMSRHAADDVADRG
ncbi:MAG: RNA polymerase subunit sigma [Phycisphaerales bacterium]|jgi:RNA polymerase sigma factor (TIGR02999 family)|nr:RNA polymerase subunit sigma [Phycisphaerales bacterium]